MNLRKNNTGITLIELVISLAITAIVLSMIVIMISTATRSFRKTNENVNLQMEAQITINQLNAIIMEASDFIEPVTITAPDKKFVIRCKSDEFYSIVFIKDKKRVYLVQRSTSTEADGVNPIETADTENQYLLAEYVSEFDIVLSADRKTAQIEVEFELGNETYSASKKVKLRNAN